MKLSQKVNITFLVFATIVGTVHILYPLTQGESIISSFISVNVAVPMLIAIVFAFFQKYCTSARNILHVLVIYLLAFVYLIESSRYPFGLGFAILGLYLSLKYGFLKKYFIQKVSLFTVVIATLIIFSAPTNLQLDQAIVYIAFSFFFLTIIYFGEWELMQEYRRHKKEIADAMEEIQGKKIDLQKAGFTPREIHIGRLLIYTKASDKELAYLTGLSTHTMRNHMRSMRSKTNSNSRQQLIDAIRWYYHTVETLPIVKDETKLKEIS